MGSEKNPKSDENKLEYEKRERAEKFDQLKKKLIEQREKLNSIADESYVVHGKLNTDMVNEEHEKFDVLAEELRAKLKEMKDTDIKNTKDENEEK